MQTVTLNQGAPLVVKGLPVPTVRVQVVNAIRVYADARGKTHFEFQRVQPTRVPAQCAHVGTFRVRGRVTPYTWSRGALFGLRCGDCGAELE
ncbi:MAG: hypothetical protein HZC40_00840 [Chloroflexi bacterium]|nr:hypothetical protein [Chloroflexota bacterium]